MSRRKTIAVEHVRQMVNHLLTNQHDPVAHLAGKSPEQAYRLGAASLLEGILHDTGHYAGFRYLGDYRADETRRSYFPKP